MVVCFASAGYPIGPSKHVWLNHPLKRGQLDAVANGIRRIAGD